MSCGMNIRSTFRESESNQDGGRKGMNSTHQGATNELLQSYLSMQKGESELSASNRIRHQL